MADGSELLVVLVVEDEFLILEMVEHALVEGGFQVETVPSGEKAIALLEAQATKYCALITDIHLRSSLTGWNVAKRARELTPDFPVVYMSGAAANEWTSHGVPQSVLINKPFAPAQIVAAVSQLLNAHGSVPDRN